MTKRSNCRIGATVVLAIAMTTAVTHQALAQMVTSVRVISIATVLETPRGDSVLLGTVEPGEVLAVLEQQGNWYLVLAPEGTDTWQRGWVRDRFVEIIGQTAPRAFERSHREGDRPARVCAGRR